MSSLEATEHSLRAGDPAAALQLLYGQVRASPAHAKLRIFLFQLLAVLGQWERALTQLDVAAELDVGALAMAQMYRAAIRCEALRAQVFSGQQAPMVFGQPEHWVALLIEALMADGRGQAAQAASLRAEAFEQASPSGGQVDGQPFAWIADADPRLGPVLEAIIDGKYLWIPFTRFQDIVIEAPEDLRDVVWMPAHFRFTNGGESVGLVPSRYPGSETSGDGLLALGRKTSWRETGPGVFEGLGQRLLATDLGEISLMETRKIHFDAAGAASAAGA
jgi:type VI secretion system protein ImpE